MRSLAFALLAAVALSPIHFAQAAEVTSTSVRSGSLACKAKKERKPADEKKKKKKDKEKPYGFEL